MARQDEFISLEPQSSSSPDNSLKAIIQASYMLHYSTNSSECDDPAVFFTV